MGPAYIARVYQPVLVESTLRYRQTEDRTSHTHVKKGCRSRIRVTSSNLPLWCPVIIRASNEQVEQTSTALVMVQLCNACNHQLIAPSCIPYKHALPLVRRYLQDTLQNPLKHKKAWRGAGTVTAISVGCETAQ